MNNRKPRALNLRESDKERIREKFAEKLTPSEIEKFFGGKYTYWQIFNLDNRRVAKSENVVNKDGSVEKKNLKAERTVTEMPDVDYSDFASIEKFVEHMVGVIASQINEKRVTLDKRVEILRKLTFINKTNKAQLMENHLKNPNARIVISLMRRMKPDISDEEIIRIYKEESERIKKDGK
jgi:hypothetical protein